MRHSWGWKQFLYGEKRLIKLLRIGLVLLILVQILLFLTPTRRFISRVDRLEGDNTMQLPFQSDTARFDKTVVNNFNALRQSEQINIRMIKPSTENTVLVTINGKIVGEIRNGQCTLTVYDGDYIEIDATRLPENATFVVRTLDNKLEYPVNGLMFETCGTVVPIGKVKFHF